MKSNQSLEDKIEQYLLGQLPRDEHLEMERAIREQPDLAQEVELRRLEFDTAEELIAGDIRAQFQRLREQEKNDEQQPEAGQKKPGARRLWYYLTAACIALLLFLLYEYFTPTQNVRKSETPDSPLQSPVPAPQQPAPQQPVAQGDTPKQKSRRPPKPQTDAQRVAMAYYGSSQDWKKTSSVRGTVVAGSQNAVDRADSLWQRGEYQGMLQCLDTIRTSHPRYYAAQLLRAHANFSLGKYKEAAAAARIVAAWKRNAVYSEEAEWLLVLSLLADGKSNTDKFRIASENILRDKGRQSHADMTALRDELYGGPNFVPDPSMEAFVMGSSRSEGLTVKINSPLNDVRFIPNKNGEVFVRFAGTVEGATDEALTLRVYDNKSSINNPFFFVPVELRKSAQAGKPSFDLRQRLNLQQGLYYFTIERQEGGMVYAGKFTVKN